MEQVRIQKYLANCGVMSRRKAEEEILRGNVSVNGRKAEIVKIPLHLILLTFDRILIVQIAGVYGEKHLSSYIITYLFQ